MVFVAELRPRRSQLKTTLQIFEKRSKQIMKKGDGFWYSVVFTDETRVKLTSDGIVRVFRKKNTQYHEKKM